MSNSSTSTPVYKTEFTIPVKRDNRTFEQREMDTRSNLERTYSSNSSTTLPSVHSGSSIPSTTARTFTSNNGRPLAAYNNDVWDGEVSKWLQDSRDRWHRDFDRMRKDMFSLEPMGFDNWRDFGPSSRLGRDNFGSDMFNRMEREVQNKMSNFGFSDSPLMSAPQHSSSFSKSRVQSSVTTTGPDGRPIKKSFETTDDRRTIDGVTTAHSTHSKTDAVEPTVATVALERGNSSQLTFLKDAYEIGEDGQLHFRATFDAKHFSPEDIKVSTMDNVMTIDAVKKAATSSREFSRQIELPRQIDHSKFKCSLTDDGVLVIDAPVNAPDYNSITFDADRRLAIRPRPMMDTHNLNDRIKLTGSREPTVVRVAGGDLQDKKLHLEVPIPQDFAANDLFVSTDDGKIVINGQKESNGERFHFKREFPIPQNVDPLSITAQLFDNTLVIEAPLG